jgi:transposase
LRELVRHRDRLRQDFDDRVRQLHRLVDLGFPEFTRYVRSLDSMLAASLLAEYPTAEAFARASPKRLAKLRYDGRHRVGEALADQLVAAARRSVGQHHGPVCALQARHICQDLDLWRRRLAEIGRDIEGLIEAHEVGRLLTSIEGIGPHSAARIIAAVGDPARFRSAGAFAAYVGVVPGLRQSGKREGRRAAAAPLGNARLRRALWMPVLGAVTPGSAPSTSACAPPASRPSSRSSPPCESCSTPSTASPETASPSSPPPNRRRRRRTHIPKPPAPVRSDETACSM